MDYSSKNKMKAKNLFIFFFSFLVFASLMVSISAVTDFNFVQNASNPILTGSSTSSIYEPYNNNPGASGLIISRSVIKQWFIENDIIRYRESFDGNNWSISQRIYNNMNASFSGGNFSIHNVINEFGHTTYYQMFLADSIHKNIYIYNSFDGINWTKACLGNPIITTGTTILGDLDFQYTQFEYNVLAGNKVNSGGTYRWTSQALCSGWSTNYISFPLSNYYEPKILYNSYLGVYSVFYTDSGGTSFSAYEGFSLSNLSVAESNFFTLGLEQSYIRNIDFAQIYDNNVNFSHKLYMYFTIDNGGIGVAYDLDNRQLNDILGQENMSVNNGTDTTPNYYVGAFGNVVHFFNNLFPDYLITPLSTRLAYVFLVMLIFDLIILLVILFVIKSPEAIGWSILIVDILLFFYFITISYIPVAILVFVILLMLVILYFKVKGGN